MSAVTATDLPQLDPAQRLKITEIFLSLQGESTLVGWPTVFVRLTGCPLRCHYCDTAYAFHGGTWMGCGDVLERVRSYQAHYVCVTGGEPLAQKNCHSLLRSLCDEGYTVSLETSGALDVSEVDSRAIRILDIKTPGSGECAKNLWSNLQCLKASDQIKFVICNREDYEWSLATVAQYKIADQSTVLFSPSYGQLKPRALAEWILNDRAPVRMQIQLHKLLWGIEPGH